MPIVGWINYVVIIGIIAMIVLASMALASVSKKAWIAALAILAAVAILVLVGMRWYFQNTERGKRAFKTQESNLGGGLERVVRVYDMDGDLIVEYEGTFDVTHDEKRVLFDDENGKRHAVYYSTGTVTIDEK